MWGKDHTTMKQEYFKNDQSHTPLVSSQSPLKKTQPTEILWRLSKIYVKILYLHDIIWFIYTGVFSW